jgi:hypothetical protein
MFASADFYRDALLRLMILEAAIHYGGQKKTGRKFRPVFVW